MSIIAIMGSGETAPTMTRTHRRLLDLTYGDEGSYEAAPAVVLDTTFGFQANADDLVSRTVGYFRDSVGRPVEVATWRRADADVVIRERTLSLLARARWAFAGPGSPTYALRQWRGTGVAEALGDIVDRGGTVVVGSAAACTVGSHALPVYEVYKAGADLYWDEGLDLLGGLTGLRAAVVPHFDNNEGGTYDTRYCYMGADRLARLAATLPEGVGILGVDEHTAVVLDLTAKTAEVTGNGVMTLHGRGGSVEIEAGVTLSFDEVAARLQSRPGGGAATGTAPDVSSAEPTPASSRPRPETLSLRVVADAHRMAFAAATAEGDAARWSQVLLTLESEIHEWGADTLQSDDLPHARRLLRAMIVDLAATAGAPSVDVRAVVSPLVEAVVELRGKARAAGDWAAADALRGALAAAGVDVRDTAAGQQWDLRPA